MPQYEYEAAEDGEVLTLLRPMARADEPVEDPAGRGRTFKRRHSVFGVGASTGSSVGSPEPGCCPCGLKPGSCGGG
jgi:hypothetical protein